MINEEHKISTADLLINAAHARVRRLHIFYCDG